MKLPAGLIVFGCVAFMTAAISAVEPRHRGPGPFGPATSRPGPFGLGAIGSQSTDVGSEYLGSSSCQRCHESQYASWSRTLHVQMTKPIAEARVEGTFAPGTHLEQYGRAYSMETRDGRYFISISKNGRPAEKFEVNYTLGARRFQGYLSKLPDGRIYVLPVFWHVESKRWLDWKEIAPVPDDPDHDLRQIWNVTCVNCHATNLVKDYDIPTNRYATKWTEMGIGCEACHGPGRAHIALMEQWEKDPASKPAYSTSASNRELSGILKIFSPRTASSRQVFDACGYCHGNKNNIFFGFRPGDRIEDYALPFLISQPNPDNDPQGDYWPDGRPSRFNRPQALTLTGCFQRGQIACTNCHRMHGSNNDHALKIAVELPGGGHTRQSDQLCTQCHSVGERLRPERGAGGERAQGAPPSESERGLGPASSDKSQAGEAGSAGEESGSTTGYGGTLTAPTTFADLTAHTHHAADSQGSRCINCHMSDVNWRLITRRLDHTFQPPVPEMTARYGAPNACTTCHEDKSPEWAASTMDHWYGNGERRRSVVTLADAMYGAGVGKVAALPDVARIAVDRSRGALIRASAAEFVGQLVTEAQKSGQVGPAIVNALLGAAADPEPMVRITAVRALGLMPLMNDQRALSVLAVRLGDSARAVRVSAAEALMNLGVSQLNGALGQALTRVQDEWADSLRTFNDVAHDHVSLGWLEATRGRTDEANKELRNAIALNPRDPQPHVYLGVIAARAGKYDDALQEFKTAKNLDPSYRNLDRLIDEARKRAANRH